MVITSDSVRRCGLTSWLKMAKKKYSRASWTQWVNLSTMTKIWMQALSVNKDLPSWRKTLVKTMLKWLLIPNSKRLNNNSLLRRLSWELRLKKSKWSMRDKEWKNKKPCSEIKLKRMKDACKMSWEPELCKRSSSDNRRNMPREDWKKTSKWNRKLFKEKRKNQCYKNKWE